VTHLDWPDAGYCQKLPTVVFPATNLHSCAIRNRVCKALDSNTLFVGSRSKYIGKTTDGGITWDTLAVVIKSQVFSQCHLPIKPMEIAVGNDDATGINSHGIIYSTVDSGNSWQKHISLWS